MGKEASFPRPPPFPVGGSEGLVPRPPPPPVMEGCGGEPLQILNEDGGGGEERTYVFWKIKVFKYS